MRILTTTNIGGPVSVTLPLSSNFLIITRASRIFTRTSFHVSLLQFLEDLQVLIFLKLAVHLDLALLTQFAKYSLKTRCTLYDLDIQRKDH